MWPGKLLPIVRGECRWCGATIFRADGTINCRRTFCNTACVREYLLRTRPQMWRKEVYKLSMGICGGCREVFDYYEDDGWEADHIIPLFVAHALGDWTAWDPQTNGQVLCIGCHADKTKADFKKYGSAKHVRDWAAANVHRD